MEKPLAVLLFLALAAVVAANPQLRISISCASPWMWMEDLPTGGVSWHGKIGPYQIAVMKKRLPPYQVGNTQAIDDK